MNSDDIKKLRIISIDPSLISTGVYSFDRGHGQSFAIRTRGKDRADRLVGIHDGLTHHISQTTYDIALVEDYAYSIKGSQSLTALGEVRGVVIMTLRQWAVPAVDLNIAIWKNFTIGGELELDGKTKKKWNKKTRDGREAYLSRVHDLYGRTFKTTDEADAYMMFRATGRILLGAAKTKAAKKLAKTMLDILGVKDNERQNDSGSINRDRSPGAGFGRSIEPPNKAE